jgi:hypothetical protein
VTGCRNVSHLLNTMLESRILKIVLSSLQGELVERKGKVHPVEGGTYHCKR